MLHVSSCVAGYRLPLCISPQRSFDQRQQQLSITLSKSHLFTVGARAVIVTPITSTVVLKFVRKELGQTRDHSRPFLFEFPA